MAGGRIDAAFIDLNNLEYFLNNDAKKLAWKVQVNRKVIDSRDLLLLINKNFPDRNINEIVSRGISKIDANQIIKDYMDKYMK